MKVCRKCRISYSDFGNVNPKNLCIRCSNAQPGIDSTETEIEFPGGCLTEIRKSVIAPTELKKQLIKLSKDLLYSPDLTTLEIVSDTINLLIKLERNKK